MSNKPLLIKTRQESKALIKKLLSGKILSRSVSKISFVVRQSRLGRRCRKRDSSSRSVSVSPSLYDPFLRDPQPSPRSSRSPKGGGGGRGVRPVRRSDVPGTRRLPERKVSGRRRPSVVAGVVRLGASPTSPRTPELGGLAAGVEQQIPRDTTLPP